jgi:hypothetical protein
MSAGELALITIPPAVGSGPVRHATDEGIWPRELNLTLTKTLELHHTNLWCFN